jgi:hypothetical protein
MVREGRDPQPAAAKIALSGAQLLNVQNQVDGLGHVINGYCDGDRLAAHRRARILHTTPTTASSSAPGAYGYQNAGG